MDLRADKEFDDYMALTLCVKSKNRTSGHNQIELHSGRVSCFVLLPNSENHRCEQFCPNYLSSTPFSDQCITFLNCKYRKIFKWGLRLYFRKKKSFLLIMHQIKTPPRLLTNYIELKLESNYIIEYRIMEEVLLPFPYKTNCYDYEQNSKQLFSPKSREECILNYMREMEYKKCKFNRNWIFGLANETNPMKDEIIKENNCKIKLNNTLLNRICKSNCYKKSFIYSVNRRTDLRIKESYSYLTKQGFYSIKYTHLPKMDLISYLCSIGGLFSIWTGISVYTFLSELKRIFVKFFRKFFSFRYFQHYFNTINNKNIRRIADFNKLFIIICTALMLVQVFGVINNYFEYEIITRLKIKSHLNIPKILIRSQPNDKKFEQIKDKLKTTYPEFGDIYRSTYPRNYYFLYIYFIFKTLTEKSEAEFHKVFVNPKQIINSCYFVINRKKFNCPKPVHVLEIPAELQLLSSLDYFGNWNESEKTLLINSRIEKDLEKIVFEIFNYNLLTYFSNL
jgi:hypothetical protein